MTKKQRHLAALKRWRTRRANIEHAKRSQAALKGWETRRKRIQKRKRKAPQPITIIRKTYKAKPGKGHDVHLEIEMRGKKIIKVRIGKHVYTAPDDLTALQSVIEHSEKDEETSQRVSKGRG